MRIFDRRGNSEMEIVRPKKEAKPKERPSDVGDGMYLSIWRLTSRLRIRILLRTLCSVIEGFLEAMALLIIGQVALGGSEPAIGFGGIVEITTLSSTQLLAFALVLVLARLFVAVGSIWLSAGLASTIGLRERTRLLDAYLSSTFLTREEHSGGEMVQVISLWPSTLGASFGTLLAYASNAVITLTMLTVAIVRDPLVSLWVGFLALGLILVFLPIRRWIGSASRRLTSKQERSVALFTRTLEWNTDLTAFGVLPQMGNSVKAAYRKESFRWKIANFAKSMVSPVYVAASLSFGILSLLLLSDFTNSPLSAWGPSMLLVLRALSYGQGLQQAAATIAGLRPIYLRISETYKSLSSVPRPDRNIALDDFGKTVIQDASFKYKGSREVGVDGISMSLNAGDRVAMVGPSGGGKSTLLRLLAGLIEPARGKVFVNNLQMDEIRDSDLRRLIAYVPQFPKLIDGSIRENIVFMRSEIGNDEADRAFDLVNLCDELSEQLSDDSQVLKKGGATLSGGQIQRLAIARALAGGPKVLLLDEPTSSVDADSENWIKESLKGLAPSVAVVIVSHRPEILSLCNRVIHVSAGRIRSDGPLESVMAQDQFVARMFENA